MQRRSFSEKRLAWFQRKKRSNCENEADVINMISERKSSRNEASRKCVKWKKTVRRGKRRFDPKSTGAQSVPSYECRYIFTKTILRKSTTIRAKVIWEHITKQHQPKETKPIRSVSQA